MTISLVTPSASPSVNGLGALAGTPGSDSPEMGSFGGLVAEIMGKAGKQARALQDTGTAQGVLHDPSTHTLLHPLAASLLTPKSAGLHADRGTTDFIEANPETGLGSLIQGSEQADEIGSATETSLLFTGLPLASAPPPHAATEIPVLEQGKRQPADTEDVLSTENLLINAGLQSSTTKTDATPAAMLGAAASREAFSSHAVSLTGKPNDAAQELQLQASANIAANLTANAVTTNGGTQTPDGFQQFLHQATAANPTPAVQPSAADPASGTLHAPVRSEAWSQEFGEKIVWMARNDQQQAQLSLNPAHLGPLQISLNLEGEQATASFIATTPEVRQALEDALPRLREMLAGAGISLGQTQVGTQSQQEQAQSRQAMPRARSGGDGAILDADSSPLPVVPLQRGAGLVDLFA